MNNVYLTEGLDASGGTIFTTSHGHVNRVRSFETSFDVCGTGQSSLGDPHTRRFVIRNRRTILHFRSSLPQIGPLVRCIEIAVLVCLFRSPDNTCRCLRSVESGMRFVSLVSLAKLQMDCKVDFYSVSGWIWQEHSGLVSQHTLISRTFACGKASSLGVNRHALHRLS